MSEDRDLVVATVRDILAGHEPFALTPEHGWDPGLWQALADTGLTGVGLPEGSGGSGGETGDAVAVVATLAAGAGAVPVAEHLLVAGPALLAAGLPLPPVTEPWTVALDGSVTAAPTEGGWTLAGTATDVAWAGVAEHLVVVADGPDGALLCVVPAAATTVTPGRDLAGQPRGSVRFGGAAVAVAPLDVAARQRLRAGHALARAVQMSAALQQVLDWTVQYAGERQQFGRSIGKFQAVQMQLAEMAGEVTATAALVDAAVDGFGSGADVLTGAAAAKVRAGSAVEVVARLAHQVHGAIGFTQEYRLHHLTRRCWSWRDDGGNERTWAEILGARLAGDPAGLWPALTGALAPVPTEGTR